MSDDIDQIPDEAMDELESMFGNLSTNEQLRLHIELLIDEAKDAQSDDQEREFSWPYESGPSKVWNITFQAGIDRDFVNWWLIAQAIEKDGTPIYLVQTDDVNLSRVEVGISELSELSNAFQAAEEHWLEEYDSEEDLKDIGRSSPPPTPSETPPPKTGEEQWTYVANEKETQNGGRALAIRRAAALDNGKFRAYVLEHQSESSSDELPSPIGTFWGHHSSHFMRVFEEAASQLG